MKWTIFLSCQNIVSYGPNKDPPLVLAYNYNFMTWSDHSDSTDKISNSRKFDSSMMMRKIKLGVQELKTL